MTEQVRSAEGPVSVVRECITDFNKGDPKAMSALFTVPASILDGLAPHVWRGPTAVEDWYRDVMVAAEHEGATDYHVTLGAPSHADVTGDDAYVVVPASMTFKLRGKPVTQSGSVFTAALHKSTDGWRIAAWAWAKGAPGNPQ